MHVVLAREQGLTLEHLGKNASCTPNVHLDVVLLPGEHDLGGTVVAGRHVTRHLGVLDPGETKVANLQVAILVDEDVARLEIAVHDTGRVDIFQATLVDFLRQTATKQSSNIPESGTKSTE